MYLLTMTRTDHQKYITKATKQNGSPDRVLRVMIRTTHISRWAYQTWQT